MPPAFVESEIHGILNSISCRAVKARNILGESESSRLTEKGHITRPDSNSPNTNNIYFNIVIFLLKTI
jgi:hypothetical protein